jgi:hypothetical protein
MRKNETGDLFLLNPRVKTMKKKSKKKSKRSAAKRSNPAPKRAKRRASRPAGTTKRAKRRSNPGKTRRRSSARRRNPGFGGLKTFVASALGGGLVRGAYWAMAKIPQLTGYKYFGAQAAAPLVLAFAAHKMKAPNVAAGAAGAFGFVIGDLVNGAYQLHLANKAIADKAAAAPPAPGPTGLGSVRYLPGMRTVNASAGMGSIRSGAIRPR